MNFSTQAECIVDRPVYFYIMDANINTTGERIRYLRETVNKWNGKKFLAELKRRTGEEVKSSTLSNHESDTSMPQYNTLVNYSIVLGTTTDFLLLVTHDPLPAKRTDRNVLIEANGEEERRILEEIATLIEEMTVGDLRFVLDIVRRISAVTVRSSSQISEGEIEPLIKMILDAIQQIAGKEMREKALADMDKSLPPDSPFAATWRRLRSQRPN